MKLLSFIFILLTLTSCSDGFEHSYATYSDLQQANLRLKSWFPELIDSSCYDFKEIHTIGDIESYGRFSYIQNSGVESALTDTTNYRTVHRDSVIVFLKKFKDLKPPRWFADPTKMDGGSFYRYESTYFIRNADEKTIFFAYTLK